MRCSLCKRKAVFRCSSCRKNMCSECAFSHSCKNPELKELKGNPFKSLFFFVAIILLFYLALKFYPLAPRLSFEKTNYPDPGLIEQEVHKSINLERVKRNINSLEWNPYLSLIARRHSADMSTRFYFSHTTPEGFGPQWRYDYSGYDCTAFENLIQSGVAEIVYENNSYLNLYNETLIAKNAVDGWLNSTGHKLNMLHKNHVSEGIGVYINEKHEVFVTQNFCNKRFQITDIFSYLKSLFFYKKYPNMVEYRKPELQHNVSELPSLTSDLYEKSRNCERINDSFYKGACYSGMSKLWNILTFCYYAGESKDRCILDYAKKNNGTELCEKIGSTRLFDDCLFWRSGIMENTEECIYLSDPTYQGACYKRQALRDNDPGLCEMIPSEPILDRCYFDLAIKTKNSTMCDFVRNHFIQRDCRAAVK